ncbi:MAG: DUF4405 domain-containing protein [Eubacterium sp.]|nr:DUF4405 domain-containing protein [Eubacterium sp.]
MKNKAIKRSIDTLMLILLPLLMSYSLIGEETHEWLGIVMFGLFVLHHIINYRWFKNILRGKYTPQRILITVVNLLLLAVMPALPITGILMSKYVLTDIQASGGYATIRQLHPFFAYWGLVLMSIHLGFHMNMMLKKPLDKIKKSKAKQWTATVILFAVFCYGGYVFVKREILRFLFLQNQFHFFNAEQSRAIFFLDYLAIIAAFVILGVLQMKAVDIYSKSKQKLSNKERK